MRSPVSAALIGPKTVPTRLESGWTRIQEVRVSTKEYAGLDQSLEDKDLSGGLTMPGVCGLASICRPGIIQTNK